MKVSIATIVMFTLFSCTSAELDNLLEESNSPFKSAQTENGSTNELSDKQSLVHYYRQVEKIFSKAVDGIPLSYPLVEKSDPSLFLMPVADDSSMHVQRLFLVDATYEFRYDRDIYLVDSVYFNPNEEEPLSVVVSGKNSIKKSYLIDGFMYNSIIQINQNKYVFPSNIMIPVKKIPAITNRSEK